jgi:uncharacterized protein YPO0396
VRLLDAGEFTSSREFRHDGFTRKLNFKPHPMREPMKALLASIDRHCVDDAESLQSFGMTREGLMSGTTGQFDKQDQAALGAGWVTGFSNEDIVADLSRSIHQLQQSRDEFDQAVRLAQQAREQATVNLNFARLLAGLEFAAIDLPGAEARLESLEQRLRELLDPHSDAGRAKELYESARREQVRQQEHLTTLRVKQGQLQQQVQEAEQQIARLQARATPSLTEQERTLADNRIPLTGPLDSSSLDDQERQVRSDIEHNKAELEARHAELSRRLVQLMGDAKRLDNGALVETGTDVPDVQAYLDRLQVLTEEALPEKLSRFLEYLNQSSDQGVTQLLASIDHQVDQIEDRIEELNGTLRRVDFQQGRFIQLVPRKVSHERLRALGRAQSQLRAAEFTDDQGESQFAALERLVDIFRQAVDSRTTLAARALLDPRYRLQFSCSIIDRSSGELMESRTSSQGGSGGEKEVIASYILTASLSYALCPDGADRPLFGTILLDEAFSKSSQSVAGRIIQALREFGLHAVFVTPNKEMRLLREHTRSAVIVNRVGAQASLTTITWEELDAHKKQRQALADENT